MRRGVLTAELLALMEMKLDLRGRIRMPFVGKK